MSNETKVINNVANMSTAGIGCASAAPPEEPIESAVRRLERAADEMGRVLWVVRDFPRERATIIRPKLDDAEKALADIKAELAKVL